MGAPQIKPVAWPFSLLHAVQYKLKIISRHKVWVSITMAPIVITNSVCCPLHGCSRQRWTVLGSVRPDTGRNIYATKMLRSTPFAIPGASGWAERASPAAVEQRHFRKKQASRLAGHSWSSEHKEASCILMFHCACAVYTLAASNGGIAGGIRRLLEPQAEYFNTLNLPGWLVHWGHPGAACQVSKPFYQYCGL